MEHNLKADPCPCEDCQKAKACMKYAGACEAYETWDSSGRATGKRVAIPHPKPVDRREKFGLLTPIRFIQFRRPEGQVWLMECDCGAKVELPLSPVRRGKQKSCGCLRRQMRIKANKEPRQSVEKINAAPAFPSRIDEFINRHPVPPMVKSGQAKRRPYQ